ncbi:hypothetical protein KR018_002496 [Drosophila ironensis]|nr:hypothetical protein KR018_002496 [Drosophila ironensis]
MASAGQKTFPELEEATLLSVSEENGVVTSIYVTPCSGFPNTNTAKESVQFLPDNNQLMYHCPYCDNGIRAAGALKVHMQACRRRKESNRQNGQSAETSSTFLCMKCDKSFDSMELLKRHVIAHGGLARNLSCKHCNQKFPNNQELRAHLPGRCSKKLAKENRPEECPSFVVTKSFKCIFCRKDFNVRFKPDEVTRRYACNECGQKLRAREAAAPRKRQAEWVCHVCGRLYKLEGFLMRHLDQCQGYVPKRKR